PVHRAQFHAQADRAYLNAARYLGGGLSPDPQAPQQVQAVQRGEQVEESVGWIGRYKITRGVQLLPHPKLSGQKTKSEKASDNQSDSDAVYPSPSCSNPRPLHGNTAQNQRSCVQPQPSRNGQSRPVRPLHAHEVGTDQQREQRGGDRQKYPKTHFHRRQGQSAVAVNVVGRALRYPGPDVDRLSNQPPYYGGHDCDQNQ